MNRKLTTNKKCGNKDCTKRFDQIRFGQTACDLDCAIEISKQKRQKDVNKRAKNKRKDHPNVYYKENKKQLQDTVQLIARLIDKDVHCIDCDKTEAYQWDGGHFKSKGAHKPIALNLHNIFRQHAYCNTKAQTSNEAFMAGIIKMYGDDYGILVDSLALRYAYVGLKANEYPNIIAEALKVVRELKKADMNYTPKQRIRLRDEINKRLGIYE